MEPEALTRRDFVRIAAGTAAAAAAGQVLLSPGTARALPPVWSTIPNQIWVVGVPVHLDLADYVTDPEGDTLTYSIDEALPPGVTRTGSVISGTPTGEFGPQAFVASADDGEPVDDVPPAPPTGLTVD